MVEKIETLDGQEFIRWEKQAFSRPISRVYLAPAGMLEDPWVKQSHTGRSAELVHDQGCYHFHNLEISGRGHLKHHGKLLVSSNVMPFYWYDSLIHSDFAEVRQEALLPPRFISEPALVITGHGVSVYGHVLLEMLSRLQLADILGIRKNYPNLLFPVNAPQWFRDILTDYMSVQPDQLLMYDPGVERVILKDAFVPTLPWKNGQFHPGTKSLFAALKDRISVSPFVLKPGRLGLSRQRFSNPASTQRSLQNEDKLLEIFREEFGAEIIEPEKLPWHEQVKRFAGLEVAVGSYGSGLHNSVFSRERAKFAIFGFLNMVQSEIAALNSQSCFYVPRQSADGPFNEHSFRDVLRSWLDQ